MGADLVTITPMDVTTLDPARHHYECERGHAVTNSPAPLEVCPAYVLGDPCGGELTAFGPGSRRSAR